MTSTAVSVRRVLLVEDNAAWAELTREAFTDVDPGIEVQTVSNGQQALTLLLGGASPDLVLLDLNMPGLDGRDVLRALQHEPDRAYQIIVLSASVAERDQILAEQLGASAYRSKPTTFSQLRDLVSELIHRLPAGPGAGEAAGGGPEVAGPASEAESAGAVDEEIIVSPGRRAGRQAELVGSRVVVIEDSPLDAALITDQLVPAGFAVRRADSLAQFRTGDLPTWADCVLLDLDLPDAAGLDGLRAVVHDLDGVPVIVLTGTASDALTLEALAAGAHDWVRKGSMNADQLARTLRFAIERSRLQRQLMHERERFTAELTRSNADLADFAQVAAHDLRSPLQAIIGFSELLESRYRAHLDETGQEFLGHIVKAAVRMDALIEDLLAFSRVGTAAASPEPVDLGEVLTSVRSTLLGPITDSGALVTAGPLPVISGDRMQLTQLLQNLVGNAIKFVAPGVIPKVHVSAARQDGGWRLDVADNGIGISETERERVFEMFKRGVDDEAYEGTGVGLAVCQRVMRRRGGTISVEGAEGGGSRFSCFFPDEWNPAVRADPPRLTHEPEAVSVPIQRDGATPVVLLVEDGDDHAALLRAMLEQAAAPVLLHRVSDLASARRVLADDPPGCVLLDLNLPDSSGLSTLEEVRTAAPFIPVVVVTALADEATAMEALRRGAQDYVLKGRVTSETLTRTILFAIERQAQEQAMAEAALTDMVTGLANRRCLSDRLTTALARATRGGFPPAVMLIDLDGFKAVNDELGHRAGDAVLIEVAERLRSVVRGSDTVARLGGDEFVVLCEGMDEAAAEEVLARIGDVVAEPIPLEGGERTLTASVGLVVARPGEAAAALLDRADAAMYEAKRRGR